MRKLWVLGASALVAGCTSTGSSSSALSHDLARQTAGPATLASFAELCGTPKAEVDRYMESYVRFAKSKSGISSDEEIRIRDMFAKGRSGIYQRFPTKEAIKEQCTKYPTNPKVIERGMAGDFSGQI